MLVVAQWFLSLHKASESHTESLSNGVKSEPGSLASSTIALIDFLSASMNTTVDAEVCGRGLKSAAIVLRSAAEDQMRDRPPELVKWRFIRCRMDIHYVPKNL